MFLNGYPYTDFHEMNLDFLLESMKTLQQAFSDFTASNSLIFAEPLLHNITSTYAKNTIVLDADGNAYISLQNAPSGVQLSNADYWLMVFNFEDYTEKANKNFTNNYFRDTDRTPYALSVGDWVVLNDVLYTVTQAIAADSLFIIGMNLTHFTVEQFLKDFVTSVNQTLNNWYIEMTGTINQYKNDIDASELAYRNQLAQDIATTTASLQAQLDAAISGVTVDSEVINIRTGANNVVYDTAGNAVRDQIREVEAGIPEINYMDNDVSELTPALVVSNSFVKADGTYQTGDPTYRVMVYDVTGLKRIRVRGYNVSAAVLYVLLDANDTVISYYTSGLAGVHFITKDIIIPDVVTKIKINDTKANGYSTFGLSKVWAITNVYSKLQTVEGGGDNVISYTSFTPDIENTFFKHIGFNVGTKLTADGSIAGHYMRQYINNEINQIYPDVLASCTYYQFTVTPGKTYMIKTFMNAWAFKSWYAVDDKFIVHAMCEDTPVNAWVYRPIIARIPKDCTLLFVNWYDGGMGDIYQCEVYEMDSYFNAGSYHNIGVIGDSLSEKVDSLASPPNYTDKFWWEILGEKLNCSVDCVAKRGSGFKHPSDPFELQMNNIRSNDELVIVFGSGNDITYYDPVTKYGTINDVFTDFTNSSVAACMVHFFQTWRTLYPITKLVVFSPTLWNGYDPDLNPTNPKMIEYAALLKEVCEHFAVPFVDLTTGSGFTPSVTAFRNEYTADGTHLNTAGNYFIAPYFIDQVKKMLL